MTVRELIELLKTYNPNLQVAYYRKSEQCLLDKNDLHIEKCCIPRADGWVHNARPDKEQEEYLMFPGN